MFSYGVGKNLKKVNRAAARRGSTLRAVRVLAVILDDKTYPAQFKQHGEWASLGGIVFESVEDPSSGKQLEDKFFAYPLFPNIKQYPVIGEIVYILTGPSVDLNANTVDFNYYYLPPINTWSASHINPVPDELFTNAGYQETQVKSPSLIADGSSRKVDGTPPPIDLGYGLKEQPTLRSLAPFPGDILYEGRWGNSIRFSSTVRSGLKNTWSDAGFEGSPILILRNGQPVDNTANILEPIVEDINKDGGSIYLSSNQQINLNAASTSYESYDTAKEPAGISKYRGNQLILNSDRVVLNSKNDHVLLSSNKTINLNSKGGINVDTDGTVVMLGSKVQLGGTTGEIQPVLKGDDTVDTLSSLITELQKFMTIVSTLNIPGVSSAAQALVPRLLELDLQTRTQLRSNTVFTK